VVLTVCSARIKAERARQALGWTPTHGEADLLEEIEDVFTEMLHQE